jgi:hypothetical protein
VTLSLLCWGDAEPSSTLTRVLGPAVLLHFGRFRLIFWRCTHTTRTMSVVCDLARRCGSSNDTRAYRDLCRLRALEARMRELPWVTREIGGLRQLREAVHVQLPQKRGVVAMAKVPRQHVGREDRLLRRTSARAHQRTQQRMWQRNNARRPHGTGSGTSAARYDDMASQTTVAAGVRLANATRWARRAAWARA